MDEKDIETFLQARRETTYLSLYSAATAVLLAFVIFMETTDTYHEYMVVVLTVAIMFAMGSVGPHRRVKVSRGRLLEIIERQINRDPEALKLLASKQVSDA